jgi:hypothetical protein
MARKMKPADPFKYGFRSHSFSFSKENENMGKEYSSRELVIYQVTIHSRNHGEFVR